MREYGHQAVVLQTALNPVVALELLAEGVWAGHGRARPGGVRRRAVPRPARRLRRVARGRRARPGVILLVAATEPELGGLDGLVCGVGPVEAAAATAAALAGSPPGAVLHVGLAGCRRGCGLEPPALVIGSEAVYDDVVIPLAPRRVAPDPAPARRRPSRPAERDRPPDRHERRRRRHASATTSRRWRASPFSAPASSRASRRSRCARSRTRSRRRTGRSGASTTRSRRSRSAAPARHRLESASAGYRSPPCRRPAARAQQPKRDEPLPPPLPPAERTVGQLVAESIRLYGHRFWPSLALGVPVALADGLALQHVGERVPSSSSPRRSSRRRSSAPACSRSADPSADSADRLRVRDRSSSCRRRCSSAVVHAARGRLARVRRARRAGGGRGADGVLGRFRRGVELARADYVHALGGLATLAIVVLRHALPLAFLLRAQADNTEPRGRASPTSSSRRCSSSAPRCSTSTRRRVG